MTTGFQRLNREVIKRHTPAAIVLDVRGEEFLTMLGALGWAHRYGPGAERRRHAGYAYGRLVGALPVASKPETVLHRKELLALVDGLEHMAQIDDEMGRHARSLLGFIADYIARCTEMRSKA